MSHEPAAATLLRLLAAPAGAADIRERPIDWDALARAAVARDVGPLLRQRLLDHDVRPPERVARMLADDYLSGALRGRLLLAQRDAVLTALAEARVPVVVLKGCSLVTLLYGDPALRRMSDVDLLVPRERMDDAMAVLAAHGLAPIPGETLDGYHVRLVREGAAVVELHRDLEPAHSPVRFDLDALWARAVPLADAPAGARRLHLADLLLHLCVHAAVHHAWGAESERLLPLRVVLDIPRAVGRMSEDDWTLFVRAAHDAGAVPVAGECLALCARLGVAAPPHVARALEVSSADGRAGDAWRFLTERDRLEEPIATRELDRLAPGALVRASLAAAFPAPAVMRRAVPGTRASLARLYLAHWAGLLRRRGRVTLALLLRTEAGRTQATRHALRATLAARARSATPDSRTPPTPSA